MAAKFEIRSAKAGEFNWVLKSQGRTLASGESYARKVSAEKAIESLRKAAASAAVDDTTVKATAPAKPAKATATGTTATPTTKRAAPRPRTSRTV